MGIDLDATVDIDLDASVICQPCNSMLLIVINLGCWDD